MCARSWTLVRCARLRRATSDWSRLLPTRCSEFSASSRSISQAWDRSFDWSISRCRWQDLVFDSNCRLVAFRWAWRSVTKESLFGAGAGRLRVRRRRSRCLLPQRVEQKRCVLRAGLKPSVHSSHFLMVTCIHLCEGLFRHDQTWAVLTLMALDARGVRRLAGQAGRAKSAEHGGALLHLGSCGRSFAACWFEWFLAWEGRRAYV